MVETATLRARQTATFEFPRVLIGTPLPRTASGCSSWPPQSATGATRSRGN